MITALASINLMLTAIFISMKHPLSAGGILLLQTVLISLMSGNLFQNFWFSYVLFLIMIGGMLILFMYMTSIASNEKFKTDFKLLMAFPIAIISTMLIYSNSSNHIQTSMMKELSKPDSFEILLSKFINLPMTAMFIFLMVYLLLAMIATVKITSFKQGSIRQMN
uniref:NADH dehydrogenase subunit 6 n=1 Tax=Borboresthes tibialis TaxID=2969963 RepID=UPI002176AA51|nr:NADH dehydrogenase subunit 6 [Borboresthes tibialis]UUL71623.1 NADH dehydrogenase subunit 6 [Borboresthes tibialis]